MSGLRLKRVLITGAAGGLGKIMARRFAQRGAELVVADLNGDGAEQAREEIAQEGARCHAYQLDVTNSASILELREKIHRDSGKIDILLNNAGVVFGGPFLDVPLEQHQLTYRVNVEGIMAMTHAFLGDLIASPRGHLVNIASLSGYVGLPNGATYASSKWAVIGFSESIRLEMKNQGHKNVNVTTVCPSYINTGMFDGVTPPKTTSLLDPEDFAEKVVRAVELRKIWLREPLLSKVTPLLRNVLPTGLGDIVSELMGATTTMDTWRGRPDK